MDTKRLLTILCLAALLFGALPAAPAAAQQSLAADDPAALGAIQQSRLTALDPSPTDKFGRSVAISGNTAVVGAPNDDLYWGNGYLENAGAAYIFIRQGNEWIIFTRITAHDPSAGDHFGTSVAIDGGTIIVGANGKDIDNEEDVGAAYIFTLQGGSWALDRRLVLPDPVEADNFGISVAVQRDTVVIGADGRNFGPLPDTGAVFTYVKNQDKWESRATLYPHDPKFGGTFGASLAIDGDLLVVGATELFYPGMDSGPGSAYVFRRSGGWNLEAKLDGGNVDRSGDQFGASVAVSGETVVVGAPSFDPSGFSGRVTNAGAVFIFKGTDSGWKQDAHLTIDDTSAFDQFGQSVDIVNNVVLVGANGRSIYNQFRAGAAFLYQRSNREWRYQTSLISDAPAKDDSFGDAVAMDGNHMIIGASGGNSGTGFRSGKAYVYGLLPGVLPSTGFAPNQVTFTQEEMMGDVYQDEGMLLEIPSLSVEIPVVSVPKEANSWNTQWLWDSAGYLEETAFPTWEGNTGIAAHVYLPNGNPGPFINLDTLKWGDRIVIMAWGEEHIYEVRQVLQVSPEDLSVLAHEDQDWLTLVTCSDFDAETDAYNLRTIVRAVRIK